MCLTFYLPPRFIFAPKFNNLRSVIPSGSPQSLVSIDSYFCVKSQYQVKPLIWQFWENMPIKCTPYWKKAEFHSNLQYNIGYFLYFGFKCPPVVNTCTQGGNNSLLGSSICAKWCYFALLLYYRFSLRMTRYCTCTLCICWSVFHSCNCHHVRVKWHFA